MPALSRPCLDFYDIIVVGAGAGGMTAAAVAAAEGASVLVIEKTAFVGGTTAWSGGMVWIPANAQMREVGLADTPEKARQYLAATVPEPANADLRDVFLDRGPEAIAYLERNTELRFQPVKLYPDYYPDLPGATAGGRVLEPVMFDGATLGAAFSRLRPPLPEFTLFGGMMVNRLDIPHLRNAGRSLKSMLRSLRLVSQYARQRLRWPRGTTLHLGNALAARLYASLLARGVEILFGAAVDHLVVNDGRVIGLRLAGSSATVTARKGVVLATGGFSHDPVLRQKLFPPTAGPISATNPAGTGDGVRLATAAGAALATDVADAAYWVPASVFRREDGSQGVFPHTVTDRAKPGVIAVNVRGQRFINEAVSYHEFVRAMLRDANAGPDASFHLICDREFLWTYGLGRIKPFTRRLAPYLGSGELRRATSIAGLAREIGLDASALVATIDRYNEGARHGLDPQFGRGTNIYQRALGDAGHMPNPCVAPVKHAPYYALRIFPADLGTAIGVKIDGKARVRRSDGSVIAGLCACGNDMASIMNGNYPGPGITLGPALTFGYIAGEHLAHAA
ncbi:MAG TPA: FAD-dependent oxidoreductase [Bradyrhizobium sp.]|nr:FAD-dependent oxidoreductase [Bradyrhizobium sp.]